MCRTMAFFETVAGREKWLDHWAPWLDANERAVIAGSSAHWYSKKSLGDHLELYDEDRERLKAWSIAACDVSKEKREEINRVKNKQAQERYRRKRGAKPQAQSERRTKPWMALKISESTYRRRKRAEMTAFRNGTLFDPKSPESAGYAHGTVATCVTAFRNGPLLLINGETRDGRSGLSRGELYGQAPHVLPVGPLQVQTDMVEPPEFRKAA
jgi:hypothetical protein